MAATTQPAALPLDPDADLLPPHPVSRLRVLTLGDTLAGKSTLVKRFCEGRFVQRYLATIGVDYGVRRVARERDGLDVRLNFFDTSGLPAYAEIRREFYRDADVVSTDATRAA